MYITITFFQFFELAFKYSIEPHCQNFESIFIMYVVIKASNNARYMIEFFGHEKVQDIINILTNEYNIEPNTYTLQKETCDSTLTPDFTLKEAGITDKCHLLLKFKEETDKCFNLFGLPNINSSNFNEIPKKQMNLDKLDPKYEINQNSQISANNEMTPSNKLYYDSLSTDEKASIDRLSQDFPDINSIIDLYHANKDENITRSFLQDSS